MVHMIRLSDRLATIAGFIKAGASVADVGTDHGYMPVYLAQNELARVIIASDISEGSLGAARRNAARYGVADRISFVAAPGLTHVCETDADTVVISGMGGETIASILEVAPWTRRDGLSLVLQPQTRTDELCIWLRENGYTLEDAAISLDNGRLYVIMLVRGGDPGCLHDPEIELLELLKTGNDPLFPKYLDTLIKRTKRTLDGMKASAGPVDPAAVQKLAAYAGLRTKTD